MEPGEKILYLDSTNSWLFTGMYSIESEVRELFSLKDGKAGEASWKFTGMIRDLLEYTKLDRPDSIFALMGPGSFTGVRICVSTARNLSQLWEIPLYGCDSLYAYGVYFSGMQKKGCMVMMESGMKRLYCRKCSVEEKDSGNQTIDLHYTEVERNFSLEDLSLPLFANSDLFRKGDNDLDTVPDGKEVLATMYKYQLWKKFSWAEFLPNYIRGTYVDQKQ